MLHLLAALTLVSLPQEHGTPEPGEPGTLVMEAVEIPLRAGGSATGERGMLWTKLVREDPESATIGVEVWRFRAGPDSPPDVPPVFILHGGPGWGGLARDLETPGAYEQEIAPRRDLADLVIVGQRGIGASVPSTSCADFPAAATAPDAGEEAQAESIRAACGACRRHWESKGYDLSGFNVIEAAGDLEETRRLLGYDRITLWGASFGSHWGMAMLRYHPESVARAVLTGMEGPDHTYDMPTGVLRALEAMAGEAELSPKLAGRVPEGGLIEALRQVIESLEADPVELEVEHPSSGESTTVVVDGDVVRNAAMGYTGRVNSRRSVGTWPADVIALHEGDFERLARAWVQRREGGDDLELSTASFYMLDCGSGISAARLAELHADPAARIVGNLGRYYEMACPAWGADLGEDFRAGFTTDVPTVIVHGTWDVSTPFDNALECLPLFDRAHFVVVDGGTHGALGEALRHSPEFSAALMDFLVSGDTSNLPEEVRLPPIAWSAPHGYVDER